MSIEADIESIIRFFLRIYHHQLGIRYLDEKFLDFEQIHDIGFGSDLKYLLRVNVDGKWKSRRMSISPLGENIESKSMCYKVVYDDILVIKIPPSPITEFDTYIKDIDVERQISERLQPDVICVYPKVSALLKKLPEFKMDDEVSEEVMEAKLYERLKIEPELQNYLKINGSFVFFSNLSRHQFFNEVIGRMHQETGKIQDEIIKITDTLKDIDAFERLYGSQNVQFFFSMNDILKDYENRVSALLHLHDLSSEVQDYESSRWMLFYLAEKEIASEDKKFSADFIRERDALLSSVYTDHKNEIDAFRETIKAYVREKIFSSFKSQTVGIIQNIYDLIYKLRQKSVAIRDLKPDNMFVVGRTDNPDHYMINSDDYSLGLIDLETAICMDRSGEKKNAQPLLAGTPAFATPTHLFENDVLDQMFGNFKNQLFYQDLYATIGMVYFVVTNETLFEETGVLVPEIMRVRQKGMQRGDSRRDILINTSWIFWQSAVREFEKNMGIHEGKLKMLTITLNGSAGKMFKAELNHLQTDLVQGIRRYVKEQKIFKGTKSQNSLLQSPVEAIVRYRKNWEKGKNVPKTSSSVRKKVVRWLLRLEQMKQVVNQYKKLEKLIGSDPSAINVHELLYLVFWMVLQSMYRMEWTNRKPPLVKQL